MQFIGSISAALCGAANRVLTTLSKPAVAVIVFIGAVGVSACDDDKNDWRPEGSVLPSAENDALVRLWATSAASHDLTQRNDIFVDLQKQADECTDVIFKAYLDGDAPLATAMEKTIPIIYNYNKAMDRVLDGLDKDTPAAGEVHVYQLYNMGYVVKTASGAFGIDIFHRRAEELAPYLDFYAITHVHNDHKSLPLAQAMAKLGKPVLANFDIEGCDSQYITAENKDYSIGAFAIHSFITDHNNGDTNVPVTVFKIDCGSDAGHCVIMHSGDSNFGASRYETVRNANIDIYIPRYAPNALTENNVIGAVFAPDYVLLSHILELTHKDVASSRWSLALGLERASKLNCENTYMPFWGERLIWSNGNLR